MWPHIWMLAALMSKLRQQIGIDSSVIMSQAGAQPSGIVQMQLLATILQKMCCIMAELYRSDSPAGLRSFIQVRLVWQSLASIADLQMLRHSQTILQNSKSKVDMLTLDTLTREQKATGCPEVASNCCSAELYGQASCVLLRYKCKQAFAPPADCNADCNAVSQISRGVVQRAVPSDGGTSCSRRRCRGSKHARAQCPGVMLHAYVLSLNASLHE